MQVIIDYNSKVLVLLSPATLFELMEFCANLSLDADEWKILPMQHKA